MTDDYYWAEKLEWEPTNDKYIWLCLTNSRYHFSDECSQFDPTPYPSFMSCYEALKRYTDYLNQPKEKQT